MIDENEYEPTGIDTILHYTRAHSPDEWRWPKYSNSLNELSEDDRLLIEYAPRLRAEVKRLREVIKKIKDCATINAQHDDILEKQEWEYILEMID